MAEKRILKVVIAGQVPPPVTGQNIMIARILRLLGEDPDIQAIHLPFNFTRELKQARKVSFWKLWTLLNVYWALFKIWRNHQTDVMLYPAGGPQCVPLLRDVLLLPVCYLVFRKVIIHFHAGGLAEALRHFPQPFSWVIRNLYAQAAGAVVMTKFGRCDPESADIKNIAVIPNAVADTYDATLANRKSSEVCLLSVGLLSLEKGTLALLEAFDRLHKLHPGCRLVLVGATCLPLTMNSLKAFVKEHGLEKAVEFTGVLEGAEKWRRFAQADLFVFPSIAQESFGLALAEAMMWALPIVATDWRGNRDVLGPEPGGIVFPPESGLAEGLAPALAEAIAAREQWSEWGSRNREYFLRHYEEKTVEPLLGSGLKKLTWEEDRRF